MTPRHLSRRGFTLVELLVASSITAVIAAAVAASFFAGARIYRDVKAVDLDKADVLLSLDKMERDLRNAFACTGLEFYGDNQEVSFAGLVGDKAKGPALGRIWYYFDAANKKLIKEEQDYSDGTAEGIGPGKAAGITQCPAKSLTFSYYYYDPALKQYAWRQSWKKEELKEEGINSRLPAGVMVQLVFSDANNDLALTRKVFIPTVGIK